MFIILCAYGPGSVGWNDLLSLGPSGQCGHGVAVLVNLVYTALPSPVTVVAELDHTTTNISSCQEEGNRIVG